MPDTALSLIDRALTEIEAAGLDTLDRWNAFSAEAIRNRIREIETDARDWQEFSQRHFAVKTEALKRLWDALNLRLAHDEEREELARLRKEADERAQREREERLVREAEEREVLKHQQAQENAERAKAEALAKAKFVEEYARQQAERHAAELKDQQERAERQRLAAIQAEKDRVEREAQAEIAAREAREKDLAHRKAVHSAALAAFVQAGLTLDMAGTALEAVVRGAIPHIMVVY